MKPHQSKIEIISPFQEKNVVFINPLSDPYPFLTLADVLITDYSSVYFDFLLLNKPIIFYPYDYDEYVKYCRRFYFDYFSFTPGEKAYTIKDLLLALKSCLASSTEYMKHFERERQNVLNVYYESESICSRASERIYEHVYSLPFGKTP